MMDTGSALNFLYNRGKRIQREAMLTQWALDKVQEWVEKYGVTYTVETEIDVWIRLLSSKPSELPGDNAFKIERLKEYKQILSETGL